MPAVVVAVGRVRTEPAGWAVVQVLRFLLVRPIPVVLAVVARSELAGPVVRA